MTTAVEKLTQLNVRAFPAELLKRCKLEAVRRKITLKSFVIYSLLKTLKENK